MKTKLSVVASNRAIACRRVRWPGAYAFAVLPFVAPLITSCGGGGGGDKPIGPGAVASVEVSAPSPSLEIGGTMYIGVKYFDGSHKQLSGQTITYSTSNNTLATVNTSGAVTGVSAGAVVITATVSGAHGSVNINVVPVPVAGVVITPNKPSVRPGETTQLTGQAVDVIGRVLTGRTVTWSSANAAVASVNATSGLVTGVVTGSTYIRATSEGHTDSVSLRVKGLNAPSISGTSAGQLTPGNAGTLTGANFGATPNDNEVYVNGAAATVTAASATSVSFTVPSATALPCSATGPAQVMLVANGDTAITSMSLRMATARTLGVGESAIYTAPADLMCNEFPATGGRYLVTAFNYASDAAIVSDVQLVGASTAAAAQSSVAANLLPPAQGGGAVTADDPLRRHEIAHLAFQQRQRTFARQMGNPRLRERMRRPNGALLSNSVTAPPNVGDMVTYRMPKTLSSYSTFDNLRFRVVYVGSKIIMLEDSLAPLARTMDAEYQRMGQEFDSVTWPVLLNFGNPLVVDSALDNNGHMLALFSPHVNNYAIGGQTNVLLGYVTLCDYFPRVQQVVDGQTIPACPASNEAEAFYAIVPEPGVSGAVQTVTNWRRFMRSTLAHEAKHVTSYAERYYRDAEELEDTWLEEATAQVSSEIFSRIIYNHPLQFGDLGWADGPNCDYANVSAACPDPMEGILHHFSFLYDAYEDLENKSTIDASNAPVDRVIYGYSWSFVRWITDVFGSTEGDFLRSLVQVKNDAGVANIVSKSGHSFDELLGLFSLACVADNYPGAVVNDTRLRLAGWNSRDLFTNMNAHVFYSSGQPAYPLAFPMRTRTASFGTFGPGTSQVTSLRGGGFVAWDISGAQSAPQVLGLRGFTGGVPPAQVGLAIVRVQ